MRRFLVLFVLSLAVGLAISSAAQAAGSNQQFTFSSSATPSSITCALDRGAATACTSPKTYSGLSPGAHIVAVRVTATILSGTETLTFRPNEPGATFTCQNGHNAPHSCTSPTTITHLSKAAHFFVITYRFTVPLGGRWPASYFTGPLGSNEILPAVQGHTLLSLWSGVAGNTAAQQRTFVQQRITAMGRAPDFIGFSCSGSCAPGSGQMDTSSTHLSENWIHSLGAIPIVANYDPGSSTDFAGVAAGNYDANIKAAAARFKAFGHRIIIRMFEEFEEHGSWSPTDFIAAWRHVVNLFKQDGATNVGFWWSPGEQAEGNGLRAKINASYPGDAYVDWVGSDGYNRDSGYSTPLHSGWAGFNEIFNYHVTGEPSIEQQWGPEKPFFVGETGTKYDTANVPSGHVVDPNRKKNWFINIESAAASMPYLIGIDFFDQDVHIFETGNNWRVDSNCDSAGHNCNNGATDGNTYSGVLSMINSSQFSGGAVGGDS